jgi:hypothetical protein
MWPQKITSTTPYHPLRSFLLYFQPIFCFRFFEPSCSASALARGSKLRSSPPHPHVPCSQETPLHWAVEGGRLETCKFLVQVKADVAAKDRFDILLRASLPLNYHPHAELQLRPHSPHRGHRPRSNRRGHVPAQHRRPGVSALNSLCMSFLSHPPPIFTAPLTSSL